MTCSSPTCHTELVTVAIGSVIEQKVEPTEVCLPVCLSVSVHVDLFPSSFSPRHNRGIIYLSLFCTVVSAAGEVEDVRQVRVEGEEEDRR